MFKVQNKVKLRWGGGEPLVVNQTIDQIQKFIIYRENEINKIKAGIENFTEEQVKSSIIQIMNNKSKVDNLYNNNVKEGAFFYDFWDAFKIRLLLTRMSNIIKNNRISYNDVKIFDNSLQNLDEDELNLCSLLFNEFCIAVTENNNSNDKLHIEKGQFDWLSINQLYNKKDVNNSMKNKFLLAFIYKYIEDAKNNDLESSEKMSEDIKEVSNFKQLKTQLTNIDFSKFYEKILQKSERYSVNYMKNNKKEAIDQFNSAVRDANTCKLIETLKLFIPISNMLFVKK